MIDFCHAAYKVVVLPLPVGLSYQLSSLAGSAARVVLGFAWSVCQSPESKVNFVRTLIGD